MISYRGFQIIGHSGEYRYISNGVRIGPFAHLSEVERDIDAWLDQYEGTR